MPTNLPPEYLKAKEKYKNADKVENKIKYTREMISKCPKHKGAENLLKNLKKRIKKLKQKKQKQQKSKKGGHSLAIEKQGFQICIIGYPNTGKSTLLKKLTNADSKTAKYPYTTKKPKQAMLNYEGAKIQLVDMPPITKGASEKQPELMSILKNTDGLILILGENPEKEKKHIKKELKKTNAKKPTLTIRKGYNLSKNEIFEFFDLIRIYTKKPREEPDKNDPLVLKRGSTVEEAGEQIHKDFAKNMKYVRVWGSSKFEGQRVEKNHVLEDEDVIEFHTK